MFKFLLCWLMLIGISHAAEPVLEVVGDIPSTGTLSVKQANALSPLKILYRDEAGTHTCVGIPLEAALAHFGFGHGQDGRQMQRPQNRGGWKKKAIAASAADGYQAFFSGAEIASELGSTEAYLTWMRDGQPLPTAEGPFKLIVLSDQDNSRWVYTLRQLYVIDLRRIVPRFQTP